MEVAPVARIWSLGLLKDDDDDEGDDDDDDDDDDEMMMLMMMMIMMRMMIMMMMKMMMRMMTTTLALDYKDPGMCLLECSTHYCGCNVAWTGLNKETIRYIPNDCSEE